MERRRLLAEYGDAVKILVALEGNLETAALSETPGVFDGTWGHLQAARQRCADVRRALVHHMYAHGCDFLDLTGTAGA
jgi:hypothetical protein